MSSPSIVWFRNDLRVGDNPALAAAVARGAPVIPVFVWPCDEGGSWKSGAAAQWWLHHSLRNLAADLERRGSRLTVRHETTSSLAALVAESGASAVFWNRSYEPAAIARDRAVDAALRADGVRVETFNATLLFEPSAVATRAGKPFQVFTPFWNACLRSAPPAEPLPAPLVLPKPTRWPATAALDELNLEPKIDWAAGLRSTWQPGESGAAARLDRFVEGVMGRYAVARDRPADEGTSRLSPHLHFGEISPRQVWHAVVGCAAIAAAADGTTGSHAFLRQLGWREFAYHLLAHFPHTTERPLRSEFAEFPWQIDDAWLRAWQRGRTGYPFVDAAMRELWRTGWMHNRARMVVASFLVKDLLIPWQAGARWFWDTLVDADLANNSLGWQWVAGCGADAAPYFRVFHPVTQGEKFDPDGGYVRRWVPELGRMPTAWIHKPWQAPSSVLLGAGVELGTTYPAPIVDHAWARRRALAALATINRRARR